MAGASTNRLMNETDFAAFGPGSRLEDPYRIDNPDRIRIGANVTVGARAWLSVVREHHGVVYEPQLTIGDGTVLGPEIVIACAGRIEIGARVLTASRVFIGDTSHGYRDPGLAVLDQPLTPPRPVRIGDGSFIGIGAIVLPGVRVGERAYLAAGAVVTTDVPPNTVVAGNPARPVRQWHEADGEWSRPAGTPPADRRADELRQRLGLAEAELRAASAGATELIARERRALEALTEANATRAAAEAALAEVSGARSDAEELLGRITGSLSWRLTEPLRAAKRRARR